MTYMCVDPNRASTPHILYFVSLVSVNSASTTLSSEAGASLVGSGGVST